MTETDFQTLAKKWFPHRAGRLSEREIAALEAVLKRHPISRSLAPAEAPSLGERMADKVAEFGGSWTFISLFLAFLVIWSLVNAFVLAQRAFDPYPFVFLNLILSMLAAVQAPIIMMSQNRQARKDRLAAEHDYEVNLKAEIEITGLHDKLDALRGQQITRLLQYQQEQLDILTALMKKNAG